MPSFVAEDCRHISPVAEPFVDPVWHHVNVAGDILMRHTVEHIPDCYLISNLGA